MERYLESAGNLHFLRSIYNIESCKWKDYFSPRQKKKNLKNEETDKKVSTSKYS